MFQKLLWSMLTVGAVAFAGFDGGPKSSDDPGLARLIGADPDPVPCDTSRTASVNCVTVIPEIPCNYSANRCHTIYPLESKTKLCQNGDQTCLQIECVALYQQSVIADCTQQDPP